MLALLSFSRTLIINQRLSIFSRTEKCITLHLQPLYRLDNPLYQLPDTVSYLLHELTTGCLWLLRIRPPMCVKGKMNPETFRIRQESGKISSSVNQVWDEYITNIKPYFRDTTKDSINAIAAHVLTYQ